MPAPFSSRRRASSTVTVSVRKLVAVGIDLDCSMYLASAALPPFSCSAPAGFSATAPAEPLPSAALSFAASSTSDLTIRPPGPLPETLVRSTPSAAAARAATGEVLTPLGVCGPLR